MGEYQRSGIVTQFKESKTLAFKTLAEALESPGEFLLTDFSKLDRSALLHVAFQALDAFQVGRCEANSRDLLVLASLRVYRGQDFISKLAAGHVTSMCCPVTMPASIIELTTSSHVAFHNH